MTSARQRMALWVLAAGIILMGTFAQAAEPSLRWLGHAAFEFTSRSGKIYLIDPWITNPKAPKNITFEHVDGILITHAHADHVGEAFDLAKKFNAPLIAPNELAAIAKKKGVQRTMPIDISGSVRLDDITITAVQAVHGSGFIDGDQTLYAGSAVGYVVAEDGATSFYHAGDTGVFSDMAQIAHLYHPQIVLLPIGGVYTMNPAGAAVAVRDLTPRVVIPMHYGTFPALTGTPEQLRMELKRLGVLTRVKEMTPGQTVGLNNL